MDGPDCRRRRCRPDPRGPRPARLRWGGGRALPFRRLRRHRCAIPHHTATPLRALFHGLTGRGGSPTLAPRPAIPGESSDPQPANPSDPGRTVRRGHLSNARPGPDIYQDRDICQDQDNFKIGFQIIFDCSISEFISKNIHF